MAVPNAATATTPASAVPENAGPIVASTTTTPLSAAAIFELNAKAARRRPNAPPNTATTASASLTAALLERGVSTRRSVSAPRAPPVLSATRTSA